MKTNRIAAWRRYIGTICVALGLALFAVSFFCYLRYASDPAHLHIKERLQHARALDIFWILSFYGSPLLFLLSLLGLGWRRLVGLILNACAFLCALMTLGAMRGPFGC